VVDNDIEACGIGIYLAPVLNGQQSENLTQVHVRNNLIRRIWLAGILGTVVYGGRMDFVEIVGNSITGVGVPGGDGRGIWIEGTGGSASSILSIRGNVIADVTGFWGFGLYVARYPDVSMRENRIIRPGHSGVLVIEAEDADLRANHIMEATHHAIWVWGAARAMVRDNTIHRWGTGSAGSPGIPFGGGQRGIVTANLFIRAAGAPEPYPVLVDSTSIAVVVTQNHQLYPTGLAQPFQNLSQSGP
jgi:Right handed beta helix region